MLSWKEPSLRETSPQERRERSGFQWEIIKNSAPQARPPRAAGAHEAYIGPDGSIHCVNESCMYVPSVECTSVVHVVMLSLKSAGEGADSKFVPRRGVRSRARARRAGQAREPTSNFRARNTQHKVSHACARASKYMRVLASFSSSWTNV